MATGLNDIDKHNFYDHLKDSNKIHGLLIGVNAPYLSPARL